MCATLHWAVSGSAAQVLRLPPLTLISSLLSLLQLGQSRGQTLLSTVQLLLNQLDASVQGSDITLSLEGAKTGKSSQYSSFPSGGGWWWEFRGGSHKLIFHTVLNSRWSFLVLLEHGETNCVHLDTLAQMFPVKKAPRFRPCCSASSLKQIRRILREQRRHCAAILAGSASLRVVHRLAGGLLTMHSRICVQPRRRKQR